MMMWTLLCVRSRKVLRSAHRVKSELKKTNRKGEIDMKDKSSKELQSKAGIPEKRRGQQTGGPGNPDQNREAKQSTPALAGRRHEANEMFADESTNQMTGDSVSPRSNTPSTPAQTSGGHVGETGGEIVFKQRQAKRLQTGRRRK